MSKQLWLHLTAVILASIVAIQTRETLADKGVLKKIYQHHRSDLFEDESNNIEDFVQQVPARDRVKSDGKFQKASSTADAGEENRDTSVRWFRKLQDQLLDQSIRHRVAEKDHSMMERWLVDNINDLHRELKQTETDLEHYVQVTKNILAQNEVHLRQQLATALSQPVPSKLARYQPLKQEGITEQSKWQLGPLQTLVLAELANR